MFPALRHSLKNAIAHGLLALTCALCASPAVEARTKHKPAHVTPAKKVHKKLTHSKRAALHRKKLARNKKLLHGKRIIPHHKKLTLQQKLKASHRKSLAHHGKLKPGQHAHHIAASKKQLAYRGAVKVEMPNVGYPHQKLAPAKIHPHPHPRPVAHKLSHVAPRHIATAVHINPLPLPNKAPLRAVNYQLVRIGSYGCHVVDIDLNNPGVKLSCARTEELGHTRMTFASIVQHHRPLAAITGTFFDPSSGAVICNLVRSGKLLTDGHHGNTMMVDRDNKGHFLDTANHAGHDLDWSKSDFAVSCGPTLLRNGRVVLDPPSEGFHDRGLFRHASRCGLGLTADNHLMFVSVNKGVTLGGFAYLMRQLGASYAINLDGGSSTGLYVRGRYPSRPARSLTNVLMVTLRPDDPIPQEVLMESSNSPDATAPANVEDFQGAPPTPEQIKTELEETQPLAPQPGAQP